MHSNLNGNGREHQYKVLLVDADARGVEDLTGVLRSEGFTVTLATSFEEGKRLLVTERPHVLIADIRLGQFNGLQLLMRARADRHRLAAMITCVFADPVLEEETRRFGGAFLVKPVRPDHVMLAIRRLLAAEGVAPDAIESRQSERRVLMSPAFIPERRGSDRRQAVLDAAAEERRRTDRRKVLISDHFPDRRVAERRSTQA